MKQALWGQHWNWSKQLADSMGFLDDASEFELSGQIMGFSVFERAILETWREGGFGGLLSWEVGFHIIFPGQQGV